MQTYREDMYLSGKLGSVCTQRKLLWKRTVTESHLQTHIKPIRSLLIVYTFSFENDAKMEYTAQKIVQNNFGSLKS